MLLFTFVGKWFWAVSILITFVNARIFWSRSRKYIQVKPELEAGYRSLMKGVVLWTSIPWVIMGIGCVFGGVPSVFSYFRPRDGNPYVLAFYACVFVEWLLATNWIVFRGGAETLVEHPGFFNFETKNPRIVIFIWFACLAGGIFATVLMFTQDLPVPFFPK
jgi:hypothetical protein